MEKLANLSTFEGMQATANEAMGCDLEVFNDQPPVAQRKSLGQKIAGVAGAANDWMGRNVGVAVPSGREYAGAFGKTTGAAARAVGREARAIGKDAYNGARSGWSAEKGNILDKTKSAAIGAITMPIGGVMDRTKDRFIPQTGDPKTDIPNTDDPQNGILDQPIRRK